MKTARSFHIGTFLLLIILQACAAIPPAPDRTGEAVFSRGALQATYDNTLFRTFEAARLTLQEQQIGITSARRDSERGTIQAVRRDGTPVEVDFRSIAPDQTEVSIKVGAFGSEQISREISRGIESRLETS